MTRIRLKRAFSRRGSIAPPGEMISISSPSHRIENLLLLVVFTFTIFFTLGIEPKLDRAPRRDYRAFELPFEKLDFSSQRLYREIISSVPEAVYLYRDELAWPEPDLLEEEFLPPFDDSQNFEFEFEQIGEDGFYLGFSYSPEVPSFFLELKPYRGEAKTHGDFNLGSHRLGLPGMILHYTIWIHPGELKSQGIPLNPVFEGWKSILPALDRKKVRKLGL